MRTPPSQGKFLYHITHIDNMPSILKTGLVPRSKLVACGANYVTDIADHKILGKRELCRNPLSNYVPFHFYPKNPFDGDVCGIYGSENMALIAIPRSIHERYESFIIPAHPLAKEKPDIHPYDEGIRYVRWDILDSYEARDYHDQNKKNACLAECIIHDVVMPQDFAYVYVSCDSAKERILRMENSEFIKVSVNRYMFP